MLVGKADVKIQDIERNIQSLEKFIEYSDSLVPEEFKHVQTIIDNQRYVCCLLLRTSKTVDYKYKSEIIEHVLKDISIAGYTNMLVEVGTLYGLVNRKRMESFRRK